MLSSILAGLLYPLVPLVLSIVGARFQSEYFTYASILSILILISLRTFKLLHKDTDFFSIFCIGLSLIFQNTLLTNYLIGIDLHGEYFFSYLAIKNGWDINIPFQYNSSLLLGVILPFITKTLGIPLEVLFKVVLPTLLSLVPVLCYYIFKKVFNDTEAFLASIFLVSVPSFFLEITGIGKQMLGELLLVLTIYILFFSKLSNVKKGVISSILGGIALMTHYSMGFVLILYILGATSILIGIKYILKQDIKISLKPIIPVLLILALVTGVYYSIVTQGSIIRTLRIHALLQVSQVFSVMNIDYSNLLKNIVEIQEETTVAPQAVPKWKEEQKGMDILIPKDETTLPQNTTKPEGYSIRDYIEGKELTLKAAIGLDFLEQDTPGKIFRILQYITEALLVIGFFIFFLKKRYKDTWVYTSFFIVGWGFLLLTVVSPGFSNILNASRFYHLALLFIAPSLLIPFGTKPQLSLIILLPYLLFTSGMVFEVLKIDSASSLNIPYSYGLSGPRVDLTAVSSDNDNSIRNFILENKTIPVYSDQWGFTFLADKLGFDVWVLPLDCSTIPGNTYIFLREKSINTKTLCYWTGVGKRENKTFKECGLEKELKYRSLIKECGSARLYGPRLINN